MGLLNYVETTVELGWKCVNDGAELVARKLLKVHVICMEGASMSMSEAKSQVR